MNTLNELKNNIASCTERVLETFDTLTKDLCGPAGITDAADYKTVHSVIANCLRTAATIWNRTQQQRLQMPQPPKPSSDPVERAAHEKKIAEEMKEACLNVVF